MAVALGMKKLSFGRFWGEPWSVAFPDAQIIPLFPE